ncbi:MAG TPA: hypothetical protein VFN22_10775 [Gemmatimonadales bacterium]|nr:hypothetical protein [Gemmatimonadales bacterium]
MAFLEFGSGSASGFDEFSSRVGRLPPATFSDGTVALSDEASILLFDRTGRFLRRVGRRGGGPGEFGGQGIDGLCVVRGDTLVAFSGTDRRVTAFRRDGKVLGTWPYPDSLRAGSTGCFRDGTAVFRSTSIAGLGTDHPVAAGFVGHFSGRHGTRPIGPLPMLSSLGGVREAFVLPYTNGTTLTARASDFGFSVLPSRPGAAHLFRSPDQPLPYTSEDHAAFIRNSIPASATGKQREMFEAAMRNQPSPKAWPAISSVRVDAASGAVWLRLYARDRLAQDWVVVSPASRRVVKVMMPDAAQTGKWRLLAVNGTSLTVEWLDADDIPHVGLFRVRPASGR